MAATMAGLAPWLALAGVGALHGLNPASGWLLAAGWGLRSGEPARARHALLPIAAGHLASLALVAGAVALGLGTATAALAGAAAGLGLLLALAWQRRAAGLAAWSCAMSTLHGAGLMLVPALLPLCLADNPARQITASGSLVLALAAVAVHMAAMLSVTGLLASGACHAWRAWRSWRSWRSAARFRRQAARSAAVRA